jgi:hypothetical protein
MTAKMLIKLLNHTPHGISFIFSKTHHKRFRMHSASGFELINTTMDFILLIVSFWMALTARKMNMGGAVGKTISLVVYGAIVLGLAHLAETILSNFFNVPNDPNELIHRGIVLLGFILLTVGLRSLGQSLGRLKK